MFEELGLNVARQPDNGSNPRPDNRSGWLEGESPATPMEELIDHQDEAPMWDPSTQLRVVKKDKRVAGISEAPERDGGGERAAGGATSRPALASARSANAACTASCGSIEGPQGPRVRSKGARSCCSARTITSVWPTIRAFVRRPPMPRSAGAPARAPRGWSRGTWSRTRSSRTQLAEFKGRIGASVRLRLPRQRRHDPGARRARARSSSPTSSITPRSSTAAGSPRAETVVYRHADTEHLAWGLSAQPGGGADRHRRDLLDGRRRRAADGAARPGAPLRHAADDRRGARDRRPRAGRPRQRRARRASRRRSTSWSAPSARRSEATAPTSACRPSFAT